MKPFSIKTDEYELQLLPKEKYRTSHTPEAPTIGFAYEVQHGHHAFASDRIIPFYSIPNSLAFTPAGCDIYSESEKGGEYLTIRLKKEELQETTTTLYQFNDHIDLEAIKAAEALRRTLITGYKNRLELDVETNTLLKAVINKTTGKKESPRGRSSITIKRLKTLHDYMESNLAENISLNQLAKTVGLSKSYFLRAFKAATGQQPHKYLVSRRIARAKQLIEQNRQKLTQIALDCGFSSHAHMTTVFKNSLGVTPGLYREIIQK